MVTASYGTALSNTKQPKSNAETNAKIPRIDNPQNIAKETEIETIHIETEAEEEAEDEGENEVEDEVEAVAEAVDEAEVTNPIAKRIQTSVTAVRIV